MIKMLDSFVSYMKQKNMSNNTIDNYTRDLEQFQSFFDGDIAHATQDDIDNFIRHLNSMNRTPATVNRKLQSIKTFFKFLMRQNIVTKDPSKYLESSRIPKKLPRVPDTVDLLSVLNSIDSKRDKLIFQILYCTGLRRFEVIKIKLEDINFHQSYIRVLGKGSKERIVPVNTSALDSIASYIKEYGITSWLFPSSKNKNQCISTRRLNEIVQYWTQRAGIQGISPHRLRAHFCTLLYTKGADIKAIQEFAGHSSIDTTNIYTKIDLNRSKQEYTKAFN